jgi:large subunit ribosomal protein L10
MNKEDKITLVNDLQNKLKSASATVLIDYAGLSVAMQQDLQKRLKAVGAALTVTKNTFFRIAAKETNFPDEAITDTVLFGQTALIITEEDPIAPLQVLAKFTKEFEIPQMKVGIIEGVFQDKNNLEKLSALPSKDILLAQAVGAIGSPIYGLLGTLQGNVQKLLHILDQASKK